MQTMQYTNDTAFEAGEIVCHYVAIRAGSKDMPPLQECFFYKKGIGMKKLKRRLKTVSGALFKDGYGHNLRRTGMQR